MLLGFLTASSNEPLFEMERREIYRFGNEMNQEYQVNDNAARTIKTLVWSGFYDRDAAIESVWENCFDSDETGEEQAEKLVDAEFEKKLAAEKSWEAETDCDRLDRAFEKLNQAGIIALHNAGYTQSDGISDVADVWHSGGKSPKVVGYCFYHEQDTERAVKGGGLMLAFGEIRGDQIKAVEIGKRICDELRAENLSYEWNERADERIHLDKIVWRRRARIN